MTDSLVKLQCKHHEKGLSTHGWPQLILLYQERTEESLSYVVRVRSRLALFP